MFLKEKHDYEDGKFLTSSLNTLPRNISKNS